jgi:hypothetical protein
MKSIDFLLHFNDAPVALVFIDGEHIAQTVLKEVNFFLPILSPNGVIFIHDTYPAQWQIDKTGKKCGDVYKARLALEAELDLQIFTFSVTAGGVGLTILSKKIPPYH